MGTCVHFSRSNPGQPLSPSPKATAPRASPERCRRGAAGASLWRYCPTPAIVEVGGRSLGVVRLAITEKGRTMIVR
jgi:hypothetical protein